jgi:thymidylate synthase
MAEQQYLNIIQNILEHGDVRETRNSKVKTLFTPPIIRMKNIMEEFPLLTTKKMNLKHIFNELMWFIRGETDAKILDKQGTKIWNYNSSRENLDKLGFQHYKEGDVGSLYGHQMRHFGAKYHGCESTKADYLSKQLDYDESLKPETIDRLFDKQGFDQLQYCIDLIKTDPTSRRIVMSLWNGYQLNTSTLGNCHGTSIQFFVREENVIDTVTGQIAGVNRRLDLTTYQRSADVALGLPYNLASYSLFLILIASVTGCDPGHVNYVLGDTHIYEVHNEQIERQLNRTPLKLPSIRLKQIHDDIEKYTWDDIELVDYNPDSFIKYDFVL